MIGSSEFVLLVARLLLATMFIVSATDKFRLDKLEMRQIASFHLPALALIGRLTEVIGATALILGVCMPPS